MESDRCPGAGVADSLVDLRNSFYIKDLIVLCRLPTRQYLSTGTDGSLRQAALNPAIPIRPFAGSLFATTSAGSAGGFILRPKLPPESRWAFHCGIPRRWLERPPDDIASEAMYRVAPF
jgi:hypothetical protein